MSFRTPWTLPVRRVVMVMRMSLRHPTYNIFAQSQDFKADDIADLTPVNFDCREDEVQESKDELQDPTDTICSQFGDGHEDEPEAPACNIFPPSQDFTEVDDVVNLTPVGFAGREEEPQDSKDELQDSVDAICESCGDVHVFGRPAWCRNLD